MTTKREQVMAALFAVLSGVAGPTVERNEPLPESIPAGGLIAMSDPDAPDEVEAVLSPLSWLVVETVPATVLVQAASGRAGALDDILAAIGAALAVDRTLGGLADDVRAGFPAGGDDAIEGAPAVRSVTLAIRVEYSTTDPLE